MREIIPRRLWLGNALDIRDIRRLHDVGVAAVVDLAREESPPSPSREMLYLRIPLVDGAQNADELLAAAVETTASLIRKRIPTLVGCSAAMSRSPAIVAAALAIGRGDSPDNCLRQLIAGHPHDVSSSLWADVKRVYNDLAG